jgi:hypothetical protein
MPLHVQGILFFNLSLECSGSSKCLFLKNGKPITLFSLNQVYKIMKKYFVNLENFTIIYQQ